MNPDLFLKLFADRSPTEVTINDPSVLVRVLAVRPPDESTVKSDPLVKLFADRSPTEVTINEPPPLCRV